MKRGPLEADDDSCSVFTYLPVSAPSPAIVPQSILNLSILNLTPTPTAAMSLILWVVTSMIRWIRLKHYQYEVTFAVYMLTPTEKFIFSMRPVLLALLLLRRY